MSSSGLWGDLPLSTDAGRSPKSILKEQADALNIGTKGLLKGDVRTETRYSDLVHELVIIAPFLNNYEVTVFSASHGAEIYPVVPEDLVGSSVKSHTCNNEAEFEKELQLVLTSDKVRRIIASLLSQTGDTHKVAPAAPSLKRQTAE